MNSITHREYGFEAKGHTRIVAVFVVMTVMAYLLSGYISLLILLTYHFFVRLYISPLFSPLEFMAGYVSNYQSNSSEDSQKEFAAHLALLLTSLSLILELYGHSGLGYMSVFLLLVWKSFEVCRNICFGCKLYEFVWKKGIEIVSL
ncbi:DUF4395 family protein [Sulfurovum sp. ST-21]|uniref:DUF4395 family protein n=1 Tax=Sulfurovum indicum TaxID=2779528 RepID=A0A7M1S2J4_9BACT|nr:DUF4395 family protein [Sulfurovum indicum]QOR61241.1 DUF4395 family protein [Sulfurovum indicum]